MTTILSHPQGCCQSKDRQAEYHVEDLKPSYQGKSIPHFTIDAYCLHPFEANHDDASPHRANYCPFARDEHRRRGQQHPASYHKRQQQTGDGVVIERRASQPRDRYPLGKHSPQKSDAPRNGTQCDKCLYYDECTTYEFVVHCDVLVRSTHYTFRDVKWDRSRAVPLFYFHDRARRPTTARLEARNALCCVCDLHPPGL